MFIPDSLNQNNLNTGRFAYQTGLELSYRVFKNFKIGVGGIYSSMSSEIIIKKIPDDDIFNYDIYFSHTLKYTEFPLYIRYDVFKDKKLTPYFKLGISATKINVIEDKLIKTDPAGHESDFWAQFYNFTFKNELLYITNMRAVFAGAGADYAINNSFNIGINANAKRCFYYEFDAERSNYTLSGNLTFSYMF